jgi:Uma2 family endonuclease
MAVSLARKLWSADEYERLIENGILDEDNRVELIRGDIVELPPIGIRHAACVVALGELFHELLDRMVTVSVQNPIRLPDDSEPQPDIALLRGHRSLYTRRRPTAGDVLLLVEVSDTTPATDREVKVPLYAGSGIPQVWVVNLDSEAIEVYSEPVGEKYQKVTFVARGEKLALPGGMAGEIALDEVLG